MGRGFKAVLLNGKDEPNTRRELYKVARQIYLRTTHKEVIS